jgi:D-aspartate ligase
MILKLADRRHFHEGRAPRLVVAAERLLPLAGEVLVQKVIGGPDDAIYFCPFCRGGDGETLGMFTRRPRASALFGCRSVERAGSLVIACVQKTAQKET